MKQRLPTGRLPDSLLASRTGYTREEFAGDLVAGLTVGSVPAQLMHQAEERHGGKHNICRDIREVLARAAKPHEGSGFGTNVTPTSKTFRSGSSSVSKP